MAAAVLAGLARQAGRSLLTSAITKAGEQLAENPRGLWEGIKEAGHRLITGDIGGLIQQGVDFFKEGPRKAPTDRVSDDLADDERQRRPKDAVRKHAIKKKPRRRKEEEIMEIPEEFFEEENVEAPTVEMPEAPHVVREPEHIARQDKIFIPSVSPAPKRTPVIRHVAGGVKKVPGDPYGKLEFTSRSLFPQPRTSVEQRRDRAVIDHGLSEKRVMVEKMERIYGPMDTTVRELRKQIQQAEYGNTSGPFVPNRFVPPSNFPERLPPPSYREAMERKARENPALLAGAQPKQKHHAYPTMQEAPAVKAAVDKAGKPLKGAAKASFEKSQVKVSVPKKKLKK